MTHDPELMHMTIDQITDEQALDLARNVPFPDEDLTTFIQTGAVCGRLTQNGRGLYLSTRHHELPAFRMLEEWFAQTGARAPVDGWDPTSHRTIPPLLVARDVTDKVTRALTVLGSSDTPLANADRRTLVAHIPQIDTADQQQLRTIDTFAQSLIDRETATTNAT
jgi:hypothetical protein